MARHDPEQDEEEAAPLLRGKTPDRTSAPEPTQALLSVILLPTLLAATSNMLSILDRSFWAASSNTMMSDMHIDNSRWGILNGPSFLFFYTFAATLLAPVADNVNRPRLIAVLVGTFSLVTAIGGLAQSARASTSEIRRKLASSSLFFCSFPFADFGTLVVLRIMLGVAESILTPTLISFLTSVIPVHRRGLALSFVSVGKWLGAGGALFTVAVYPSGWRATSFIMGAVGMAILPCVLMIKDAERPHLVPATRVRHSLFSSSFPCALHSTLHDNPFSFAHRNAQTGAEALGSAVFSTHRLLWRAVQTSPAIPLALLGYTLFGLYGAVQSFVMLWLTKERGFEAREAAAMQGMIMVR